MNISLFCKKNHSCSECTNPCKLDESIPCSPDCPNLSDSGQVSIRKCLLYGCDAIFSLIPEIEGMTVGEFMKTYGTLYQIPDFESLKG